MADNDSAQEVNLPPAAPQTRMLGTQRPEFYSVLATRHLPLRRVAAALTPEAIVEAVEMLARALPWMGFPRARIGVCGLNPHAGDGGALGDEEKTVHATGDGPVDACFNAVKAIWPHHAVLQLYQVHAVTEGTDAQATVSVRLEEEGKISTGQSADTDTVVASTRAYVNALNKLLVRRLKTAPAAQTA